MQICIRKASHHRTVARENFEQEGFDCFNAQNTTLKPDDDKYFVAPSPFEGPPIQGFALAQRFLLSYSPRPIPGDATTQAFRQHKMQMVYPPYTLLRCT